jgi:hypothetical protein
MKASELDGTAWAFASISAAQAVYQTALAKPGFVSDRHDSSLDTGFFASRPVLIFLWGPSMDPELVESVQRLAVLAGGSELEEGLKQELLRQIRLRWRVMRPKGAKGGMVIKHHPQGRVWTDLRD